MKFGQELKNLQTTAQPPFRGAFLNYRRGLHLLQEAKNACHCSAPFACTLWISAFTYPPTDVPASPDGMLNKEFARRSSLKKFLKYRGLQLDAVGKGPSKARAALLRAADQDFLRMLTAQLKEVDRCRVLIPVHGLNGNLWEDGHGLNHCCMQVSPQPSSLEAPPFTTGKCIWDRQEHEKCDRSLKFTVPFTMSCCYRL